MRPQHYEGITVEIEPQRYGQQNMSPHRMQNYKQVLTQNKNYMTEY